MSTPKNFYEAFTQEVDALTIMASYSAAQVVGEMTRAAKRAQLVMDEELAPIGQRAPAADAPQPIYPLGKIEDKRK